MTPVKLWTKSLMWDRSVKKEAGCGLYVYTPSSTLYNCYPFGKIVIKILSVLCLKHTQNKLHQMCILTQSCHCVIIIFLLFQTHDWKDMQVSKQSNNKSGVLVLINNVPTLFYHCLYHGHIAPIKLLLTEAEILVSTCRIYGVCSVTKPRCAACWVRLSCGVSPGQSWGPKPWGFCVGVTPSYRHLSSSFCFHGFCSVHLMTSVSLEIYVRLTWLKVTKSSKLWHRSWRRNH